MNVELLNLSTFPPHSLSSFTPRLRREREIATLSVEQGRIRAEAHVMTGEDTLLAVLFRPSCSAEELRREVLINVVIITHDKLIKAYFEPAQEEDAL